MNAPASRDLKARIGVFALVELTNVISEQMERSSRESQGLKTRKGGSQKEGAIAVTDAIHKAGTGSRSRFESTSKVHEAMPAQSRDGDAGANIFFALGKCSLGSILVARSDKGICSIQFGDDPILLVCDLQEQFPTGYLIGDEPAYEGMVDQVIRIVENPQLERNFPLDVRGTEFQQLVWKAVQQIPAGSTATYSDIAQKIGMPNAARAVAEACAANVLAVAIPCHRVIRADGSLSGYRWGVERKRALLESEVRA